MTQVKAQSYVAGEWIVPTGATFRAQNPDTAEYLAAYNNCQGADVARATHAAFAAYPAFKKVTPEQRSQFLLTIGEEIMALGDDLLSVCDEETGLGLPRLTGERGRTVNQINAFADIVKNCSWIQASIDTADAQRAPLPKPDMRKMLKPIGPVAVFGASNFPFAFGTLGGDTASALAAGNPVVVKGHPSHPATNALFAQAISKAIEKCAMPKGIFSLLQGHEIPLSVALVNDPRIQAVGFTGSLQGGRAIMNTAAQRPTPIPVFAEMGSTNPMFFTQNALQDNSDNLAAALAGSVCMGTGQFCTSPGIIVLQKNPQFVDALQTALNQQPKTPMLNMNIGSAFVKGVKQVSDNEGVEWLNPKHDALVNPLKPASVLLKTTAETFLANDALHNELFGPATLIVECDTQEEMAAVATSLEGNLTTSIHATDADQQFVAELQCILEEKAGRIIFNGFPTGVEVCGSQHHGGPYPASSNASTTSVGIDAIHRFTRFVSFQNAPANLLPAELADSNPYQIIRRVDGQFTRSAISA